MFPFFSDLTAISCVTQLRVMDITYHIDGITCQKCVRLITEALTGIEGVTQVWLLNILKMINILTLLFSPPGNRCQGTECCDGAIEGTFRIEKSFSRGHREPGQWKIPGHGG